MSSFAAAASFAASPPSMTDGDSAACALLAGVAAGRRVVAVDHVVRGRGYNDLVAPYSHDITSAQLNLVGLSAAIPNLQSQIMSSGGPHPLLAALLPELRQQTRGSLRLSGAGAGAGTADEQRIALPPNGHHLSLHLPRSALSPRLLLSTSRCGGAQVPSTADGAARSLGNIHQEMLVLQQRQRRITLLRAELEAARQLQIQQEEAVIAAAAAGTAGRALKISKAQKSNGHSTGLVDVLRQRTAAVEKVRPSQASSLVARSTTGKPSCIFPAKQIPVEATGDQGRRLASPVAEAAVVSPNSQKEGMTSPTCPSEFQAFHLSSVSGQLNKRGIEAVTPAILQGQGTPLSLRLGHVSPPPVKKLKQFGVRVKEQYSDPVHLAVQQSSVAYLKKETKVIIAREGCSVLTRRDGRLLDTPLLVYLKSHCCNDMAEDEAARFAMLDYLLSTSPTAATLSDRQGNTPLHVAAAHGCKNLHVYQRLISMYPRSLLQRNMQGKTPLDLCQERMFSDDRVVRFLTRVTSKQIGRV